MRDLFTIFFCPKGPSSGNINIIITRKIYWVLSDPYRNETLFLQLILPYIFHLPIIPSITTVKIKGLHRTQEQEEKNILSSLSKKINHTKIHIPITFNINRLTAKKKENFM
jgi:hypothetical protein